MAIEKESWLHKLAVAFDVPLEALELKPPSAHLNHAQLDKMLKTYLDATLIDPWPGEPIDWESTIAHWEHPGTVKMGTVPLSNHASGAAVDINMAEDEPMHMHFEPDPSAPYLEGDGDIDSYSGTHVMSFNVLGKAQPLVVQPPHLPMIWETALGKVVQNGEHCKVELTGVVSTAQGSYQLGAELVTLDPELAKQLIGVIPNDGPGTGNCFLEATAGHQLFTWEAGTGWIPKPVYTPLHASLPEFSVKKGGIKFGDDPGYQAWKGEQQLFDPPTEAAYGWFCTLCEEHMIVHKGDPIACDSGGYLRPATSAEHKLAVLTGGTPS